MTNDLLPDAHRITNDLQSGDPRRVAAGLAELDRAERRRLFVPLPPPMLATLAAFGDAVPEESLLQFLNVLRNYPLFDPAPDPDEIRKTEVEAVLAYGGPVAISQVGLDIRTEELAAHAARQVMWYLMDRDFESAAEQDRAEALITHLLDGDTTHATAADGLASMALFGRHPELVQRLLPQLDDSERERVHSANDSSED